MRRSSTCSIGHTITQSRVFQLACDTSRQRPGQSTEFSADSTDSAPFSTPQRLVWTPPGGSGRCSNPLAIKRHVFNRGFQALPGRVGPRRAEPRNGLRSLRRADGLLSRRFRSGLEQPFQVSSGLFDPLIAGERVGPECLEVSFLLVVEKRPVQPKIARLGVVDEAG